MPYADPEQQARFQRAYYQKCAEAWRKLKEQTPCFDCGGYFEHYLMEWDHVRGKKWKNVSQFATVMPGTPRAQSEVDKCDLVCLMCHGRRTYYRRVLDSGSNIDHSPVV